MRQRWFALSTALLGLAALSGAGHAGVTTDRVTLTPQASPSCPSGKACLYSKSSDNRVFVVDATGLELGSNTARSFRVSASCGGLPSPALGDVCYDTTLDQFLYYTTAGWGPAVGERPFVRTCTLTSATAATAVTCLTDAAVGTGKKAYLAGWHAKVNGATPWATVTSCQIKDRAAIAVPYVTLAVAALTANAFLGDHSSNVTQESAYALGTGTTTSKGLQLQCDVNGTGSDLVVTLYGVLK